VRALTASLIGLCAAWLAFNLVTLAYGESPAQLLVILYRGTWGTGYGVGQVLYKATPLMIAGLAVAFAMRAGLFNVGVEGQAALSGLGAAAMSSWLLGVAQNGSHKLHFIAQFAPVQWVLILATALTIGCTWAVIAGLLKVRFGAHEVVSTIVMNRIADALIGFALASGLALRGTVRTADVGVHLPRFDALGLSVFRGSAASVALFIALAVVGVVAVVQRRTVMGRELPLVAGGFRACEAAGVPVKRRLVQAMLVSGAIAALVPLGAVFGFKGYYELGLGAGVGFSGIAVAILGAGHPFGLVAAALVLATLEQGGLALNGRVPMEVMDVLKATVIIVVAWASGALRRGLASVVPA
jgi:simple sugar transport system permease protein